MTDGNPDSGVEYFAKRLHKPEASIALYLGPDLSDELARLEAGIDQLAKSEPQEASRLLRQLRKDFASHDRRWRPWLACEAERGCRRECSPDTGCVVGSERRTEDMRTMAKQQDWAGDQQDWRDSQQMRSVVESLPVSAVRKNAMLQVWCGDCDLMIAAVLSINGRLMLTHRTRTGPFNATGWIDRDRGGGEQAPCRRKKYWLSVADVASWLTEGPSKVILTHAMK